MPDIDGLILSKLIDADRLGVTNPNQWRYTVLMAIADAGDDGATDNELADLLQPPGGQNNIRPRRGELVERGFVRDSGVRRRTSSGSQATVWRLTAAEQSILTPAFTTDDCVLAGAVAKVGGGGPALTQVDRERGDRLRARFALIGRRARRAAAALDIPVAVSTERSGPIALTVWRAEDETERFQVKVSLGEEGMNVAVQVAAADSGEAAVDSRVQRFRSELANLPSDVIAPLEELVKQGWNLSTVGALPGNESHFNGWRAWSKALVDDPTVRGNISRTLNPTALAQAGPAVVDEVIKLVQRALPLAGAAEVAIKDPVQALIKGLLWDEARARNLIALTRRAKQLLFAGPPGTGKTLAARILSAALADESRIKLVQFHPTYAYEDFVEGIRPVIDRPTIGTEDDGAGFGTVTAPGGLRYELRNGVFKKMVEDARSTAPEAAHFLIIDEINRANLPRVLGELLFALEYRGEQNKVELAYSTDDFYVPENVWVIGTMNTADRSVALLDAAMRRRFKEVRFDVDYAVIQRWHERNTSADLGSEAAARLERLNTEVVELLDDDRAIGHSFLLRRDLADIGFEVVWTEDLEPVLRDHLLGRVDDLPALREAFLGSL